MIDGKANIIEKRVCIDVSGKGGIKLWQKAGSRVVSLEWAI
ncbi:hypothetical protein JOD02_001643 [Caldicoprobacter guelmensis]|nr:hypothetical protein [Caldicoprobacter guelmensis]